jgi:hypothetical protein
MFKVTPASLQKFVDTKLTLTPSVIPKFNYVMMTSDWNCYSDSTLAHGIHVLRLGILILYAGEASHTAL